MHALHKPEGAALAMDNCLHDIVRDVELNLLLNNLAKLLGTIALRSKTY